MGSRYICLEHGVSCIALDCTFVTHGISSRLEDSQILCVAAIADLTVRMVGDLSWSRQNIWPNGVRTNDDMNRFARLIVGPTASLEDYSQSRLPEDREDIFLFVSRGGCEQGTRLAEVICFRIPSLSGKTQPVGVLTEGGGGLSIIS